MTHVFWAHEALDRVLLESFWAVFYRGVSFRTLPRWKTVSATSPVQWNAPLNALEQVRQPKDLRSSSRQDLIKTANALFACKRSNPANSPPTQKRYHQQNLPWRMGLLSHTGNTAKKPWRVRIIYGYSVEKLPHHFVYTGCIRKCSRCSGYRYPRYHYTKGYAQNVGAIKVSHS